tara:strand:+ start:549 stop:959 length:411 start_codon:yes stop_codon:yes gene_type:complete
MSLSDKTNINPKLWGPYFWQTIHFVAFGYPENPNDIDKKTYADFYENMMKVLPCDKCTISAQELFKKSNISNFLNNKKDLIKWTHSFHKSVNNKLKKESPTLEEFIYNFTNRPNNKIKIIILILLILLFLYKVIYN